MEKKPLIIMGIDPGTRVTGYGVITDDYCVKDYGCIKPPAKAKLTDRYKIIYDGVCSLLEHYSPEYLVVETQYVGKNPQSAIKLGMARGVVILAAKQNNAAVVEYAPSRAKKAVCHGRASKSEVQTRVKLILRLKQIPEPEDAADALALAICHAHAVHMGQKLGLEI